MTLAETLAGRGLVFILWGGLVATAFNVAMLLLKNREGPRAGESRVPTVLVRERAMPRGRGPPRDTPEREFEKGRIAGKRARASEVDGILDRFAAAGLGDARILRSVPGYKLFRVGACRSCASQRSGACEYERAFLSAALETLLGRPVRSRESACSARGAPACEFEVTY